MKLSFDEVVITEGRLTLRQKGREVVWFRFGPFVKGETLTLSGISGEFDAAIAPDELIRSPCSAREVTP